MTDVYVIATLLLLLSVKHTICDLAIQRLFPAEKKFYFNPPAHIHYFHHGLGSFLAGLIIGVPFAVLIGVIDYFAHWHIDYAKTLIREKYNMKSSEDRYWLLQAADQTLHFATYYLIALIAITW